MTTNIEDISKEQSSNGVNSERNKNKKKQRRQLPVPNQSNSERPELELKGKISTTQEMVNSKHFELYKPFVLDPKSNELYIKVDKNAIVSLVTGNKFSTACTGYKVSL